jgi:threonylcarbamoyladenosine tRNA methylthiotransferase MtaB
MARVWAEAVGCKVSQADAETIQAELVAAGHRQASVPDGADMAVVTTCCVTAEAERRSRQRIRRLLARGLPVVVTGCAARYRAEQFAVDRVAVVSCQDVPAAVAALLGGRRATEESADTPVAPGTALAVATSRTTAPRRTRSVLKVQDGCTSSCTYCAVRLVRGAPWSLPLSAALDQARAALSLGCGELVVSGINLGLYSGRCAQASAGEPASGPGGNKAAPAAAPAAVETDAKRQSQAPTADLAELVTALAELPELQRLRLSSIEPLHVTGRLLAALAHPRVARHLHIPLQSADDGVLAAMGRPYTFARYCETLDAVRAALPEAMISTDVIVGFPTESQAAFNRTLAAIGPSAGFFGRVHVFSYSSRPGTPAARHAPLSPYELRRRRSAALAAAAASQAAAAERLVGSTIEVLLEDRRNGMWRGYSSEYARCRVAEEGAREETAKVRGRHGRVVEESDHRGAAGEQPGRRGELVKALAVRREGTELRCRPLREPVPGDGAR